jgi:hypothetical protein
MRDKFVFRIFFISEVFYFKLFRFIMFFLTRVFSAMWWKGGWLVSGLIGRFVASFRVFIVSCWCLFDRGYG